MTPFIGGAGDETYTGTPDDDVAQGNGGNDTLSGGAGSDWLDGGNGDDVLNGEAGNDQLFGGADNDVLDGGVGEDLLHGGAGDDIYYLDADDVAIELADEGIDLVRTSAAVYFVDANVENVAFVGTGDFFGRGNVLDNVIDGGDGNDELEGWEGDDTLSGGAGDDLLEGGANNDMLDGGAGLDELRGGAGDDTYLVDDDTFVVEQADEGTDMVRTTLAGYVLESNVENLTFVGTGYFFGQGNALGNAIVGGADDDLLRGHAGNDTLTGGAGTDELEGGDGDDVFLVAEGDFVFGESFDGGLGIDELRYTGTSDIDLSGAPITGVERLVSTPGARIGLVMTQLSGFSYVDATVQLITTGYISLDTITFAVSDLYLANGGFNFVDLTNTPGTVAMTIHGGDDGNTILGSNSQSDTLYGGAGDDLLKGNGGDDLMYGGAGNDQYYVEQAGDQVFENADEGVDKIFTNLSSYTLGANFENLQYFGGFSFTGTGNDADNIITGGLVSDTLRGGAGRDELHGAEGSDILVVGEGDYADGEVYDGGTSGTNDRLRYTGTSDVDFSTATITAVERLEITTSAVVSLTIAQLQSFTSVTGAVRLTDGGTVLVGGVTFQAGSTLYLSDAGNSVDFTPSPTAAITVHGGAAADTVTGTGVSDNLYGGGGDDALFGGASTDFLYGEDGSDSLDGGAGSDVMVGGAGNDYYTVDNAGDQVFESDGEGYDNVYTSTSSYTLSDYVEGLVTIGTGYFTGVGNGQGNTIVGGDFGNNIDGRGGNDIIYGGAGSDTLRGAGGTDGVYGRAGNDVFQIAEGDVAMGDRFDGGADADQIYYLGAIDFDLSVATIVNIETLYADWGTTVSLTVSQLEGFSNVDAVVRLTDGGTVDLTGTAMPKGVIYLSDHGNTVDLSSAVSTAATVAIYGGAGQDVITGTAGNDTLTGGGGDDVLDGLAGDDVMTGGTGDDTYYVDSEDDQVVENFGEGAHDLVVTTLSSYYVAGTEIEDLTYVGTGGFTGYGDGRANIMTGGNDVDWFFGGGGTDTLYGNGGNDSFFLYELEIVDGGTFDGGDGTDTFQYLGVSPLNLSLATLTSIERLDSTYPATISVSVAQLESLNYVGANVTLKLVDGGSVDLTGVTLAGSVLYLSDSGNTVDLSSAVSTAASVTVHGGAGQDDITGTAGNDTLIAGDGNDVLDGGAGADSMTGGTGDDTYHVDNAGDQVIENAGEGDHDKVITSLNYYSIASTEIEALTYNGNDTFGGIGNGYDNVITGGGGHDTLSGGGGADTLYGNAGDDIFIVNEGDGVVGATFDGGSETDSLVYNGVSDLDLSVATLTGIENLESVYPATIYLTVAQLESLSYVDGNVTLKLVDGGPVDLSGVTITNRVLHLSDHGNSVDLTTAYTVPLTVYGGAGEDQITGTTGNDTLSGGAAKDSLSGAGGNDVLILAEGDYVTGETFDGGAGTDELRYTGTSELDLSGATLSGIERLVGNNVNPNTSISLTSAQLQSLGYVSAFVHLTDGGAVSLSGITMDVSAIYLSDLGNQIDLTGVLGTPYINVMGGRGNDTMIGNAAYNVLSGYNGNDVLDGKGGADYMAGGDGDDVIVVDDVNDDLREYSGNGHDRIETTLTSYALSDAFERHYEDLTYTGTGNFTGSGNALDNAITGGTGNDTLSGGTGKDSLIGGNGDDVLILAEGDYVVGETFDGGAGTDELRYTGTSNIDLTGATLVGIERLVSSASPNALISLTIAQLESLSYVGGHVRIAEGGTVSLNGITMQFNTIDLSDDGNSIDASSSPGPFGMTINGGAGADTMLGTTGHGDILYGNGGDDWLDGQGGGDLMAGGAGDDTYVVDSSGDQVTENLDDGTDTVRTTLASYTLALGLENLIYTGTGNFIGAGNSQNNVITGGDGNDQLAGSSGTDSLNGGDGNDTLVLTGGALSAGDSFDGGAGTDELRYTGSANIDLSGISLTGIERLWVTQLVTVSLTVEQFENLTFVHPSARIQIVDGGAVSVDGTDMPAVSMTLSDYGNSIDLASVVTSNGATVRGGAAADEILGTDSYGDTLYGGGGNDVLDGRGGDDTMTGGAGDDTFYVDSVGDNASESMTEGHDRVYASVASYSLGAGIEDLVHTGTTDFVGTGNELDNAITGGAGNDTLTGGAGKDVLTGGGGDDKFVVADGHYVTGETFDGGSGTDELRFTGDNGFDLSGATLTGIERLVVTGGPWVQIGLTIAQLESLSYVGGYVYLTDGGVVSLDGITMQFTSIRLSELGNTIDARSAGPNALTISGGAGNDTMLGSNTFSDSLIGGGGSDWLDGGFGVDFLTGGTGDDTYVVDNSGDQVNEDFNAGIDLVRTTAASFTLGANVENLIYTGNGNFNGAGNGLANAITGGAGSDVLSGGDGNDTLDGGLGADTLTGGTGDDSYFVDNAGDVVVEAVGGGEDRVSASVSYSLAAGVEVEKLTTTRTNGTAAIDLTGNEFDDRIYGNAGANVLDGAARADVLNGLGGDDVLVGGDGRDRIDGGDGNDVASYATAGAGVTVWLDRAGAQNTGGAGVDRLIDIEGLIGSGYDDKLTGNAANNALGGGDGNDLLNGAGGDDTMAGGAGLDIYTVDSAGDLVIEAADAGIDTVRALVDHTLADNVENLILGGAARTGTGNALGNMLAGTGAGDTLAGLAGADTILGGGGRDAIDGGDGDDLLDGGTGKDMLTGGAGRDTFAFHDGDMGATRPLADVIADFSQADGEQIQLDQLDADLATAGDQGFAWIGNGAFTGVAGQLHYAIQGGNTYVEGDTNGDGTADFVIALSGVHSLVAGDFLL